MKLFFIAIASQLLVASLVTSALLDIEKLLKSMNTPKSSRGHQEADSIPKPLVDEFTTYVDRLMASRDSAGLTEADMNREMKYDFNELRKAMSNDVEEREYTLKPGQVEPLACSKTPFGCCPDGSAAPSVEKEACAVEVCEDVYKDQCNEWLEKGELDCKKMWKKCPFSCSRCRNNEKALAAPITNCERANPGAFCCWDGMVGTGPEGKTCRPCVDTYRRACIIFKNVSRGCRSNSWRIRHFMQGHCPRTCGACSV